MPAYGRLLPSGNFARLAAVGIGNDMIAREWRARCPQRHKAGFTEHLRRTGGHDAAATPGFRDAQMLVRDADDEVFELQPDNSISHYAMAENFPR
ncbi:MAG: hypothetical protein P8011_06760 [Acidihalobacter sp.]|uniref:hypothetical protein n=1 Tax=Acidihalobacter sp. TaxID=1872108 RepID=UPI00307DA932